MKRALLLAVIVCSLVPSSGCCLLDRVFCCRHWGCFGGGDCGVAGGGGPAACGPDGGAYEVGPPGPPSGSVTYPYYTNRGPRDFLVDEPRSIGP